MVKKLTKASKKIVEKIKETAEYQQYLNLKRIVERENKAALIADYNRLQQELVNLKALGLEEAYTEKKKEYQKFKEKVENDVVLALFIESQDVFKTFLRDLFNQINQKIAILVEN